MSAAQQKLFHVGSGRRDRAGAVAEIGLGRVMIRIDGVKLTTPNAVRFATKGGIMANAARVRKIVERVRLECYRIFGPPGSHEPPMRCTVTRLSSGELDMDNAWSSCKPVFDGIALAFGLPNDRELQKRSSVAQQKTARGTFGVLIEFEWEGEGT
jgi:hypothetical protein